MSPNRIAHFLALTAVLAACAQPRSQVPEWLHRTLAPPLSGSLSVQASHTLTVTVETKHYDLLGTVVSRPKQLQIIGTSAQGLKLFTARWDGNRASVWRHPSVPETLDPHNVLADVQLVYYPAEFLRAVLPADWFLQDDHARRALYWRGELVQTVDYGAGSGWQRNATVQHHKLKYRLVIEPDQSG